MSVRVYLAGDMAIEHGDRLLRETAFGGRQPRVLFAYLALADGRPVPKGELADVLWPGGLPSSWAVSLAALVSKLRALLGRAVLPRDAIDGALGCYQLRLPAGAWVDVLAAGACVYQAEGALLRGDHAGAAPLALVAATITRRPFLAEESGPWVERVRADLVGQRLRALEILAETLLAQGDSARAGRAAQDVIDLDPYRETGYQLLMRALASTGNRADALVVYDRCRRVLRDDLGVDPSPRTEAVYLEILRG